MSLRRTVLLGAFGWLVVITTLHATLNSSVKWFGAVKEKFHIGFIPVTCHLTCPVTDFINKSIAGEGLFHPMRFNGFPEIKEMFLSGRLEATFILAPLAMSLREQGVPIKIVYLGHRDGTAMMVHKDSGIFKVEDLRGKRVAIPSRFSNQRLMLYRALQKRGMTFDDLTLIEMMPPDMPSALETRAVDAVTSGEPFMGQTELDGYGRVLYQAKDEWPGFISCVLAVNEKVIETRHKDVTELIRGIAQSGKWLDQSMDHRLNAAQFVAKNYYNQDPRLLSFVLSKPPDRVKYSNLALHRKDFEEIERLGVASGVLEGTASFEDYADPSLVPSDVEAWKWPR